MAARRRLTLAQFKSQAQDGQADPGELLLQKALGCQVKVLGEPSERTLDFTISTSSVDRDDDIIEIGGWRLDDFKRSGVVLWAHQYKMPPIARPFNTRIEGERLRSEAQFTPPDMNHPLGFGFGHTIFRMYQEGYLHAVSVGFDPIKWAINEERGSCAIDFLEQDLLEFSPVPIGANAEALEGASAKGIDTRPIYDWVEYALDAGDLVVPRETLEQIHKSLRGRYGSKLRGKRVEIDAEEAWSLMGTIRRLFGATEKRVISYAGAHPDGTPLAPKDQAWGGPAQVAAAEVSDLRVMATWVDAEHDDTKGAYKLPHHMAAGRHSLVWRGTSAAMGALMGARGGVDIPDGDRRGVYNHLARHYREFDEDPPEFRSYSPAELATFFPEEDPEMKEEIEQLTAAVKALTDKVEGVEKKLEERAAEPEPTTIVDLADEDVQKGLVKMVETMIEEKVRAITGELD